MADKYRYIGKATPRKDAVDIVTGATRFLDDNKQIKFPDLLHGKGAPQPPPPCAYKEDRLSKARRLKGVKAVLTWEDVPDWKGGTPRVLRILDRKVRFVGDAVALVAASARG